MGTNSLKRKRLFLILACVITSVLLVYSTYYYFIGSRHITTDNAYVGAEIAQATPATGGTIKKINYNDTNVVRKGDVLVVIEDTDTRLALARAKADLAKAQVQLDQAKIDYTRRVALEKSGSISGEEITNAENAYKAANASLDSARVAAEEAKINLERTIVRSPIDGVVAKRQVQLGQRVQAGASLMSIVPLYKLHVDANFKEVQLKKVKIGQPAKLTADVYGHSIVYHGRVAGIAGGTGSAFSLIPAQNATGNWIKVVQRMPVRIEFDPQELKLHPLRVGLSMEVDIDVSGAK